MTKLVVINTLERPRYYRDLVITVDVIVDVDGNNLRTIHGQ